MLSTNKKLVTDTIRKGLRNFIGANVTSNTLNAVQSSICNTLDSLVSSGQMQSGYKVEVNANQPYNDSIEVSITLKVGILYEKLDLSDEGEQKELAGDIMDEIKKYDIDEVLRS